MIDEALGEVVRFPSEKTARPLANDPVMEFLYRCADGRPPAAQKLLFLDARQLGLIDDATTEVLIDSLGLGEA